ncbi:tubulin glycylase 3A-like [Bradysia coprophila]|uniref:tubulin glycylase 3A-like n=1 Tax=Bradysia coprophila TaxID=38358 RepID=UPI00187D8F65|nr:tubulin glycylase 3A-like [Bradysia coprophila]
MAMLSVKNKSNGKLKATSAYVRPNLKSTYTSTHQTLSARSKVSQKTDITPADKKPTAEKLNTSEDSDNEKEEHESADCNNEPEIPEVYKKQGTATYSSCTGYSETTCLCSSYDDTAALINSKRLSYSDRRNWISTERLYELRKKAQDAIKHKKTFTIRGCFYSIRKGLIERGWVEKLDIHRRAPVTGLCQVVLEDFTQHLPIRRPGESRRQHLLKCERNIISRFLEHMPIDFLWSARKEKTDWIDMARNPSMTINKFHKSPFTTKEGLNNVLHDFHWFFDEGKSETYFPRSFNVWSQDELGEFIDNFRLSACISLLRFIMETSSEKGVDAIISPSGQISAACIEFAMKQCKLYVRSRLHFDIDEDVERIWDHEWDVFLMQSQMVIQEGAKIKDSEVNSVETLLMIIEKVLEEMAEHWSQYNLDGVYNIWIVKPSNRCRGRGIHLMNDLKKILTFVNPPVVNKGHYVLQKYIERPLIIHNCKFDIRQWFLVTSVQPLVIWMYNESYLRFSSQEFTLVDFHESVHLTNHAVQKRYKNGQRDERLPRENMWDCHTFQAYLRQIGKAEMWSEKIYPGMQKALIGTLLASQDTMDRRLNTFELFGADFMVSEDCQPWLIEINSSPDLGASTSVTARLCPQCLDDVLKVVIDYRNDPKVSTGGFQMIYKQVIPPAPAYLGLNLFLKGTQILHHKGSKKDKLNKNEMLRNTNIKPPPVIQPHYTTNKEVMPTINASRTFIIDFTECDSKSPERINRIPRKPRLPLFNKKSNYLTDSAVKPKIQSSVLRRTSGSKIFNENSARGKPLDSARRHASCGPRLTSIVQNSNVDELPPTNSIIQPDPIESNNNKKEFECIGNKCCVEGLPQLATDCNENSIVSKSCTPRKGSVENLNLNNKKQKMGLVKSKTSGSIPLTKNGKLLACIDKDYQKFVGKNVNANKIQNRPVNDGYCSHFFAVGLSLRAWRSKYNKIAKLQKDGPLTPIPSNVHATSDRKIKSNELLKVPKSSETLSLS